MGAGGNEHMTTENDLRRALMRRTDINAGTKLTLMAVLLRVDWQTWAGPCTVADLAQLAGISARTVRYGLQAAEELNMLSRGWGSAAGKAMPIITLNTANIATVANTAHVDRQNLQPLGGKICTPTPAKFAPLQLTTFNQPNFQHDQPEPMAEEEERDFSFDEVTDERPTKLNSWHKLTDEQIAIIEQHCSFKTGFYERCRVARKHLNIRLHRGGYYEQL